MNLLSRYAVLLGACLVPTPLAAQAPQGRVRQATLAEDLQMFSQVLHQIRLNHADSLDTHRILMAAIEGMLQAADPHSYALPATRLAPETQDSLAAGRLVPVPISLTFRNGAPFVVSASPGSRASTLDILRGDELVAVDGRPVTARSTAELEIALAGTKGSSVVLTLRRIRSDGSHIEVDRRVTRERSAEESPVPAAFMIAPDVGYLRVTTFASDRVDEDLRASLDRLDRLGMQRLILDLRDNGGGSTDEAMRAASTFLAGGSIVYIMELRGRSPDTARVSGSGASSRRHTMPLAVLVNRGTASAAELVAGALQDHDRAVVLGQPTFGKSLVMQRMPLTDGSLVVLVTGRLRTPCGRNIQREYRDLAVREYYQRVDGERDTTGTPACVTPAGRRLFAGGGIVPDQLLPDPPSTPLWLSRLLEADLILPWAAGFLSTRGDSVPALEEVQDNPTLSATIVSDFRQIASTRGFALPDSPDGETLLNGILLRGLVLTRDGLGALLALDARFDPEVREALRSLGSP